MGKSYAQKQKEAKERQEKREKISAKDQLSILDSKLGKNIGAKKERERLLNLINTETVTEKPKKKRKSKKDEQVD